MRKIFIDLSGREERVMVILFGQQADGLQCGLTAHARGCNRLTVHIVGHIPGRIDACDRRLGRAGLDDQISPLFRLQLAFEQR